MTAEPLLPGDANGIQDAYLWRDGSLARLPGVPYLADFNPVPATGGTGVGPFLSHDGSTVAYITGTALLPRDGDTTSDVYVARVDGGFPEPPAPQLCQGEECRGAPSAAPQVSGAGTAAFEAPVTKPVPACRSAAHRAQRLSHRAKRLRRAARRAARHGQRRRALRLRHRARRFAGAARRNSKRARRCRARHRANTNRRAGK